MKKVNYLRTSHLTAMVLVLVLSIGFTSCSKDEDEEIEDVAQLGGTWKHEYTNEDGKSLVDTFWFNPELETGEYIPAVGWKGYFSYSIKTPGIIHLNMTYYRYVTGTSRQSFKYEENWSCHKKGNRLWIDNKEYRKVSDGRAI